MSWRQSKKSRRLHWAEDGGDKSICGKVIVVPEPLLKCGHCEKLLEKQSPPVLERVKTLEKEVRVLYRMLFRLGGA